MNTLRSAFSILALVIGVYAGALNQAWAHAQAVTQTPAPNAIVSAPAQVRIAYSEALEPAFSNVWISDAKGKPINTAKAAVDTATRKIMVLELPALTAGNYRVKWVAVAKDGHRTQGDYTFTVK